ncbi:MAG: phosphatidylglycerophosphatase A, partial [Alphaproteobacteria bacterium]
MATPGLPSGLRFGRPSVLVATWFGAGLLPKAPGTWGSLTALPLAWALHAAFGWVGVALGAAGLFLVGWWATDHV